MAYMSQTQEQQHFTISEVAADWHIKLMVRQGIMQPPTSCRANKHNIDPGTQQSIFPSPISHTSPSPRSSGKLALIFLVPLRVEG